MKTKQAKETKATSHNKKGPKKKKKELNKTWGLFCVG